MSNLNQKFDIQTAQKIERPSFYQRAKMKLGLASGAVVATVAAGSANAAIDTTAITTEISGLAAPIAAIGGAILLILVAIKGWKLIRRAM